MASTTEKEIMDISVSFTRLVRFSGTASIELEMALRNGDAEIDEASATLDGTSLNATFSVDIQGLVEDAITDGDVDGDIEEEGDAQDVEINGLA